jgi:hypothetical protein
MDEWLTPRLGRFTHGKQICYPLYRRLGGPRAGLNECAKPRLDQDSIPGPFSAYRVAELSGLHGCGFINISRVTENITRWTEFLKCMWKR